MYTLGLNAKLRDVMAPPKKVGRPAKSRPTSRLGDWYAHALKEPDLVLCVSLETLLPVLLAPKPEDTVPERLAAAVGELLNVLGVPRDLVEAEVEAMGEWTAGRTTRRWVNDAIMDFSWQLAAAQTEAPTVPLAELSLRLAELPCSFLSWKSPDEATRAAFGLSPRRHRLKAAPRFAHGAEPAPRTPSITWNSSLDIGVPAIDAQHRELFAVFGELLDGILLGKGRGEVARLVDFLGKYVVDHFTAEEAAMVRSKYPELEAHRAEHRAFIDDLQHIREQLRRDDPSQEQAVHLCGRIRSWLSFHIGGSDRAFGQHLQQGD